MSNAKPYFKPVYIFGAGVSRMLNAPLLNDFLPMARSLLFMPEFRGLVPEAAQERLRARFQKVFEYQTDLLKSRRYVSVDLENLETLFSMLDMDWQTNPTGNASIALKEIREGLFDVVIGTLKGYMRLDNGRYRLAIRRLSYDTAASFVTFNYDLAIESALCRGFTAGRESYDPLGVEYADSEHNCYLPTSGASIESGQLASMDLKNKSEVASRPVLKLHGSCNWTYCEECKKFTALTSSMMPISTEPSRHLMHDLLKCTEQKALNLIVPPTWYKLNYSPILTSVWARAISEISTASHIVVAGYSFPRTDLFFQQVLTLGLRKNETLKRVFIINTDDKLEATLSQFFDTFFWNRMVRFLQKPIEDVFGWIAGPKGVPIDSAEHLEQAIQAIA